MRNLSFDTPNEAKEWVEKANQNEAYKGYKSHYILVGKKTVYCVLTHETKSEVVVSKKTNNPFGGLGKTFESIDEAMETYKSKEMKVALLKIKAGIAL